MKIHDCFILLRIDICLIWDVILHTTWRFVRNIYLFELVGDDTIRYIGGVEQWKENFVTNIRKKAEAITTENMLEFVGPVYQLEKALENPLDIAYHFYLDGEGYQSFAEKSFAFMEFVCTLEPGTILYIGGVIDYHF